MPALEKDYCTSPTDVASSENSSRRKRQWFINMFLINFVEFSSESSRGIILATLYLYNKSLGGDLIFMGFLTSLFSVGRFLSSLIFGVMCDKFSFRTVYIVSSLICLFGNILYLVADRHVMASKHILAISRFVVGFGAGNRSVCRANVAAMTSVNQRLKYITILATVVFFGYALTPGLGSLVAEANFYVFKLHINKFTAPGVILILLNSLTIVAMLLSFDESVGRDHAPPESAPGTPKKNTTSNNSAVDVPSRLVYQGLAVFILLNFNARGILSVFETVNIPLFLQVTGHDPSSTTAVVEASHFQLTLGLLGLVSYFSIEFFRHRISDVQWLYIGFASLAVGNLMLCTDDSGSNVLSYWRLATGELFVWSIGCPITTAVVVAAFSKILGGRPQGALMGLLGSAASVSRMVLPLLPSVFSSYTPLFLIDGLLCITSVAALWWYNAKIQGWRAARYGDSVISERSPLMVGKSSEDNQEVESPPRSPLHMTDEDEDI